MVFGILASSFVGGAFSHWLFFGTSATYAQPAREVPAATKTITAERFNVVNKKGKIRATLTTDQHGEPILAFFDTGGKVRAQLNTISDGSAGLTLNGKNGRQRVSLWSLVDARAGLWLYGNRNPKANLSLYAWPEGTSAMTISNESGKIVWSTGAQAPSTRSTTPVAPKTITKMSEAQINRLLKVNLPKLDFPQMRLDQIISHFTNVSGLAIEVNWQALAKAGIGRFQKVTVRGANISFGDAIRAVLSSAEQTGRTVVGAPAENRPRILGFLVTKDNLIISTQKELEKKKK
jgi:hypothetical protein